MPHSIPITPWQLHFFSGSAGCEWLFVTLGWVGSSTYGGCVLGCIRAENAVGWALDPSAGLPTPRRLELQPEPSQPLKHFIVPPDFFLWWGGVGGLTPDEECTVRRRGGRARCDCFTKHGARGPFSGAAQTDTLCLGRGGPRKHAFYL